MIDMETPKKTLFSCSRGAPTRLLLHCRGLLKEFDELLTRKTFLVYRFNRILRLNLYTR